MGQRLLVGATGLLLVVLLMLLASAIYRSASTDTSVQVMGAPKADTVANIATPPDGNQAADDKRSDDPLAALGAAPGAQDTPAPTPHP